MRKRTNLFILAFVLFGNLWIWKIFSFNFFLALLVLATSVFLHLSLVNKKGFYQWIYFLLFFLLSVSQFKTSEIKSLTELNNYEQYIQQTRLRLYPPVFLRIGDKTIWIPIAHWFEGRPESIAFFRIMRNFSQVVDPNLYFFANHPRELIETVEFEKYPYILLPFFIYGSYFLVKKGISKIIFISLVAPLILVALIGSKNPVGPFSLFPFISLAISCGVEQTRKALKKKFVDKSRYFVYVFIALFVLVFIQIISYEIH